MNHPATSAETDTIVHRISPGDTLSAIVKRYYGSVSHQKQPNLVKVAPIDPAIR
jgi:LysM repeat protein